MLDREEEEDNGTFSVWVPHTCVSLVSAWEDSDTVVYWMTDTDVFVLLYLCGHHMQNVIT